MTGKLTVGRLTARQKEVLRLVGQGYTSKQIARQLGLSPSTVDNHLASVLLLMGAESRSEAARLLAQSEVGQNLPSDPQALSTSQIPSNTPSRRDRNGIHFDRLPPIGGGTHELSWSDRTIVMLRIATVALASVTAMTLVIAGVIEIISRH